MTLTTFESGYDVPTYVARLRNYRSLVRGWMDDGREYSAGLASLIERIRTACEAFPPPIRASIMTEDWCGDSACNIPIVTPVLDAAGVETRVLRGSEHAELKRAYEEEGTDHIPVVSLWDGQFAEISRWVEAPAAVGPKKEAWKSEHAGYADLYERQKEDRTAAREFASLYRTFLEEMGRWYHEGMWTETIREVAEALERAKSIRQ
jgi:hypothetical protein